MREELERAAGSMRIPKHPNPYYLSYLVRDEESFRIEARFGALVDDVHFRSRNCLADVRVGSYRHDQVQEGGLTDNSTEEESYDLVDLPYAGAVDGVRHGLWRLTEARYREAVDAMLRKRADELTFLNRHRNLASFQRMPKVEDVQFGKLPQPDLDHYRKLVMQASASMKKLPYLRSGSVKFWARNSVHIFVSTEGTLRVQTMPHWGIDMAIWYLSPKGDSFPYAHSWFVANPNELPTLADLKAKIRLLYKRVEALSTAPEIRSFAGPVLLEPRPAGLLIHEAIGHRLEGARLLSAGEGQTFRDSVGERVLPPGLSVWDDPSTTHFEGKSLVGHYHFDDEGVTGARANLIEDGVLKGFLTSRTPIGKKHSSNGHGRSCYHARAMSRMAVTTVEAEQGLGDAALREAFLEEINRQGAPYGIRVHDASGGETSTDSYNFQAFLGDISFATRVFPDGREEPIRGVDFVGTPLNAVRSIVAAGKRRELDNAHCGAESGYVPVSTISPALLFSELELQNKPERPLTQHSYPMPWDQK